MYVIRGVDARPSVHSRRRGQLVSALMLGLGLPALLWACDAAAPLAVPPTDTPETLPAVPLPAAAPADDGSAPGVHIAQVDREAQCVDLHDEGDAPQPLYGWVLAGEGSSDQCWLSGVVGPGETLRVWAMTRDTGKGGCNCGFGGPVWPSDQPEPVVLYDSDGREVDRHP